MRADGIRQFKLKLIHRFVQPQAPGARSRNHDAVGKQLSVLSVVTGDGSSLVVAP